MRVESDREDPHRPLRDPRPVERPDVDSGVADAFSRPADVSGGMDDCREQPRLSRAPAPADPVLAEAFGRPEGEDDSFGRPPDDAAAGGRGAADVRRPDPWRSPETPVTVGDPAYEAEAGADEPIDLTRHDARPRLGVREMVFGRRLSWQATGAVAAVVALIALAGGAVGSLLADTSQVLTSSSVRLSEASGDRERPENATGAITNDVLPSVVNIQVSTDAAEGEGSGFVIDPRGYIATNNHVVTMDGAAEDPEITVVFDDGSRVPAEIVGTDPLTDLAVLKVDDVSNLTVATLGDSDGVQVGETVVAIGSPLGLSKTVTEGIVSATNRPIALGEGGSDGVVVIDAVQTDAAINPGNSGGPLIDASGAVIGINTSIFTQTGGSIGLGFAIPVNDVKRIVESLITEGEMEHAAIGVNARSVANAARDGALIAGVRPDGPADAGGVREGDVVTSFDDRPVRSSDELVVAVRQVSEPREVPVTVVRDGTAVELTVTPEFG